MSTNNNTVAEVKKSNQATQEVKIFSNEKFGTIRTLGDANEPWFCLTDVCKALDLSNPSKVKASLREKDCKIVNLNNTITSSEGIIEAGNPNKNFVNESGLYQVIFQSRKKEAVEFRHWVTDEVLPMIRKTGMYLTEDTKDKLSNSNDEAIKELIAKYDEVKEELKTIQPAKQFYDNMVDTKGGMLIRDFAKALNIENGKIKVSDAYKWFRANKFTTKNNLPCELQRSKGHMTVRLGKDKYGRLTKTALITELGVKYYHALIVNNLNWIKE